LAQFEFVRLPEPVVFVLVAVAVAEGTGVDVPGGTGVPGVALGEVIPEMVNVIVFVFGGGTPFGGPSVLMAVTSLGVPATPLTLVTVTTYGGAERRRYGRGSGRW
jgi:hypothetical protein